MLFIFFDQSTCILFLGTFPLTLRSWRNRICRVLWKHNHSERSGTVCEMLQLSWRDFMALFMFLASRIAVSPRWMCLCLLREVFGHWFFFVSWPEPSYMLQFVLHEPEFWFPDVIREPLWSHWLCVYKISSRDELYAVVGKLLYTVCVEFCLVSGSHVFWPCLQSLEMCSIFNLWIPLGHMVHFENPIDNFKSSRAVNKNYLVTILTEQELVFPEFFSWLQGFREDLLCVQPHGRCLRSTKEASDAVPVVRKLSFQLGGGNHCSMSDTSWMAYIPGPGAGTLHTLFSVLTTDLQHFSSLFR